jgi:predicted HTH transcriptional regulator
MPEITYKFGGVLVTFTGDVMGKGLDGGSVGSDGAGDGREETMEKVSEESSQESREQSSVKSSVKIIELIRRDNYATIPIIAENIGLTARAIEKQIAKLQIDGLIRRIGPDKGGHWEVVETTDDK